MAEKAPQHTEFRDNVNSFNSFNSSNSFNNNIVNINTKINDERRQILEWLSPLEPQQRHQGVRNNRLDGVGNWLLQTNEFRRWSNGEDSCVERVLFCYGNPGVGKTHFNSLVIDSLCDQAEEKDIAVAGLYCDYLAHEEQSTANMLGAILKQLVGRGEISQYIQHAFQKAKREFGGRGVRLPDLVGMLKSTIASLPQVFICIDALDECLPKYRLEMLGLLRDIVRESPTTRIFLTGRSHIRDEVETYLSGAVMIPIVPTEDDIRRYLEMRLDRDTEPMAMDNALRAEIFRVIPETISQIFLLVALNIDAILEEVTISQRRKKLHEMIRGNGLQDAYTATLARVKAQKGSKSRLGMQVLMWVSHSVRPLKVNELCHALGVEIGTADLDVDNIPAIETLLGCSLGLVTLERSYSSAYTVRLVHSTLQEYLSGNPELFHSPHSMIAEVCLTYLNFQYIIDLSPTLDSAPPTTPFLEYASCYWGTHSRRAVTESVKSLALRLLDEYDKHISSKLLLLRDEDRWIEPFDEKGIPRGFTGLHGIAYIGIVEIAVALLEMKEWDLNTTDVEGTTAIGWAARKGHDGVLRVLLEQEHAGPDTVDKDGRTPLSWAAANGNEGAVKMLLQRKDVNPDSIDCFGRTPLSRAAAKGNEEVIKILLEREDVNPDRVDRFGRTPLSRAAAKGNEEVVKMLLEREDVAPDTADKDGRTPLSWVAENGCEGVMEILLEQRDLNPDTADGNGRTPISWATQYGNEGIVKMLLERADVNPDTADNDGRTPLSWAAQKGNGNIMRMLLEQVDISANTADKLGRTPLLFAVRSGHEKAVKMLLWRKDVNPNTADNEHCQTPLLWAASRGYSNLVKILLGRKEVNPNLVDKNNQTPLLFAAANGREGVVKVLLQRDDVNLNLADNNGRTPISWAARYGREGIVKMLLERTDVNPDTADNDGRTPLSWAAENSSVMKVFLERQGFNTDMVEYDRIQLPWAMQYGHEGAVKMLLEREDVNPDTADNEGRTPLSWAAEKGQEEVVKMLLERHDVNPNAADMKSRTPLFFAVRHGRDKTVKLLVRRGDINPNTTDNGHGQTPLLWAASRGDSELVKILLDHKDVDPNLADKNGRSPLFFAAANGCEGVVQIFRQREDVNPDLVDNSGRTPLSWAAEYGHTRVVEILLGWCSASFYRIDYSRRTPLTWALENRRMGVIKLMLEWQSFISRAANGNIPTDSPPDWPSEPT